MPWTPARVVGTLVVAGLTAGASIVLSSHRMDQVESLCRRVLLIHQGRTVLDGEVVAIRERFADRAVLLEADGDVAGDPHAERSEPRGTATKVWLKPDATPESLLASLVARGVRIRRFERALPSLDEVFVRSVRP